MTSRTTSSVRASQQPWALVNATRNSIDTPRRHDASAAASSESKKRVLGDDALRQLRLRHLGHAEEERNARGGRGPAAATARQR